MGVFRRRLICGASRRKPGPASSSPCSCKGPWGNRDRRRKGMAVSQGEGKSECVGWMRRTKHHRPRAPRAHMSVSCGSRKQHKRLESETKRAHRMTAAEVRKEGRGQITWHFYVLLRSLDFSLEARVFRSVFCETPVSRYAEKKGRNNEFGVQIS